MLRRSPIATTFFTLISSARTKHGLPFALNKGLDLDGLRIKQIISQCSSPNELLYHALQVLEPVFLDTTTNNGIVRFDQQIIAFKARLAGDMASLGIDCGSAAITVIRDMPITEQSQMVPNPARNGEKKQKRPKMEKSGQKRRTTPF